MVPGWAGGERHMKIYFDNYQEGRWFEDLHPRLRGSHLAAFPAGNAQPSERLRQVLAYDRPDIVLTDDSDAPLLVLERTVEVPSGHNVGQRFARLAAAAQVGVPAVYFGPYSAFKHGGATAGPRYMNLRLFYAIDGVMKVERSPITTIRWPIDEQFEIVQTANKDKRLREYLELFFELLDRHGPTGLGKALIESNFEAIQEEERQNFISTEVRDPGQYQGPPPSVVIRRLGDIPQLAEIRTPGLGKREIVFYNVGMNYIRSDPYTGMAILYAYLYCNGMRKRSRDLVLWFPNITREMWEAACTGNRVGKHVKLFRLVADGILFADEYRRHDQL
jgi:hypothetical protein